MNFESKVVIVTGSSSGIGAAAAIAFAKEGAKVVLVGRNEEKLKNVSDQCENVGKKPLVVKVDVTNDGEAKSLINKTIEAFGKLDVLVNNAGVSCETDIFSEDFMRNYDRIVNLNLRAVVLLTHLATPFLIESKGNIVNISSVFAKAKVVSVMPYCTSKAGLNHFSRCVAVKLAPLGVRVNIVSPGPVRTDILENSSMENYTWEMIGKRTLLNKVSEPEEIAEVILFLASDKAKSITGSNYTIDNGALLTA